VEITKKIAEVIMEAAEVCYDEGLEPNGKFWVDLLVWIQKTYPDIVPKYMWLRPLHFAEFFLRQPKEPSSRWVAVFRPDGDSNIILPFLNRSRSRTYTANSLAKAISHCGDPSGELIKLVGELGRKDAEHVAQCKIAHAQSKGKP
jgi:hypothetical protein